MNEINKLLSSLNLKPLKYQKIDNIYIVDTQDNKYVIKKSNKEIYNYLISRDYTNIPKITYLDDYIIYEYEDDIKRPDEQKILDLVYLVSLLHKKTSYSKNICENDLKEIYEDIMGNINFLKVYYDVLMTNIESMEIISPAKYYLARNISLVYLSLNKCEKDINTWYKNNKAKESMRYTLNHNNLNLKHIINNHLISFEHAKENVPIYDLYKLYKDTYNMTDWYDVYLKYSKEYKLDKDEEDIFIILILLPPKIEFANNEYENTLRVEEAIEYLNITSDFVSRIVSTKK